MTTFFTSDTHFGHANIIKYCNRPFKDVPHMNEEIVRRWNAVVTPDDVVYHLGDVALGKIGESLPHVGRLNGYKVLVEGNHDRTFENREKENQRIRWMNEYYQYFDRITPDGIYEFGRETDNSVIANLSHFPYDGDSHGADRYADDRLSDEGVPLIHGHTHRSGNPVSRSEAGTLQVHVGQDAWRYAPVSEYEVHMLLLRESTVQF